MFDKAITLADVAGFSKRKREAHKRGKRRGLGISCLLEHSGGTPTESAALNFTADGSLMVVLGVHSTGQGHATVYRRLAAERLGIAPDRVFVRQGDSSLGVGNGASVGSRSTMTAGTALVRTVEALVEKGRKIAANVLEAGEQDIVYRDGAFAVTGTDRRVGLFELAREAAERAKRGDIAESLDTRQTADTPQTFPNGCHIAEVEIDPATGEVEVVTYTAVDDAGNIMDHTLIEGQMHGAVAQGLGQALFEAVVYDPDNGQLVSGSFMDYCMPRATDMPAFRIADVIVPATTNPLGVKGAGEAGTTASIAAVMNATARHPDSRPVQDVRQARRHRPRLARHRAGRVLHDRRPVRVRQDHAAAHPRRARNRDLGHDRGRRAGRGPIARSIRWCSRATRSFRG